MKPQEFRDFLARCALGVAMAGSRDDVIAIIEARFSESVACVHCNSRRVKKSGHANGLQRWKCRGDCGRTCTALTGTALAGLHKRDVWLAYAESLDAGRQVGRHLPWLCPNPARLLFHHAEIAASDSVGQRRETCNLRAEQARQGKSLAIILDMGELGDIDDTNVVE